jgi:hypothetical protein
VVVVVRRSLAADASKRLAPAGGVVGVQVPDVTGSIPPTELDDIVEPRVRDPGSLEQRVFVASATSPSRGADKGGVSAWRADHRTFGTSGQ